MQIELNALKKRLFEDNSVKNIKFFTGTNSDMSPEDHAREINKYFADAEYTVHDIDILKNNTCFL